MQRWELPAFGRDNLVLTSAPKATVQLARMLGASVSGSCSANAMPRAQAQGVNPVLDYRRTDLSTLGDRFDVVYDTSATMPTAVGLGTSEAE